MRKLAFYLSSIVFAFFTWVWFSGADEGWHYIGGIVCLTVAMLDFYTAYYERWRWDSWKD